MNLLRSEDIHLVKLAMTKNSAYDIMYNLGKLEALQIIDLNRGEQVYNLVFSKEVKQCHEV
jgi:V-type H+-transporting ATPase subunit a